MSRLTTAGRHQLMREVLLSVLVDGVHHDVHVAIGCCDDEGPKIEFFNSEGREIQWNPSVSPFIPPSREPVMDFVQPSAEPFVDYRQPSVRHFEAYPNPSVEPFAGYRQPPSEYIAPMQPSHEYFTGNQQPSGNLYAPLQPSAEHVPSISVKSKETLRFVGCENLRSLIQIKDNDITIPAGIGASQFFKVVVYNHSNLKVNLDLNRIPPPFSCKYSNVVVEPWIILMCVMCRKKKVRIPILYTFDGSMQPASCVVSATVSTLK